MKNGTASRAEALIEANGSELPARLKTAIGDLATILRQLVDDETAELADHVKLGPGGTVTGRLIDEKGRPLSGVGVRWSHWERTAEEIRAYLYQGKRIVTDADGKFAFQVVPGVKFSLSARRELFM